MSIHADVLDLFNCLVVPSTALVTRTHETGLANMGVVTDFVPTPDQKRVLREIFKPLALHTLFTRHERNNASVDELLTKQILHYIEVNGLDTPGLFDLTCDGGQVISLRYVRGITSYELGQRVCALLYRNAPVKDAAQIKRIVDHYGLTVTLSRVQNNELRVLLWSKDMGAMDNGDDAVRYLVHQATGESLLIKSPQVIKQVQAFAPRVDRGFLEMHEHVLAQVFNRHKPLILALKARSTRNVINRIARRSKTLHEPVKMPVAKTFIHDALTGGREYQVPAMLEHTSLRDKLKFLDVLAERRVQSTVGIYRIRNGKVHYRDDRRIYSLADIDRVETYVLEALAWELSYLRTKQILLDPRVAYGLPTSRKQTLGRLPYGTQVSIVGNEISSGVYWENAWGARDIDLSGITLDGARVGWGCYGGYTDRQIIFSGDMVDASNGAMEFLTSKGKDYAIFANIFNGEAGAEVELVVGNNRDTAARWINKLVIRERTKLASRNCLLGFVKGKTFVVWGGRIGERLVSDMNPSILAMKPDYWTVNRLLTKLDIDFDVDKQDGVRYDHDMSYEGFSLDKLENLFRAA